MHSLRPCLTVFAIVFALSVGATQSAEGGFKEGLAAVKRGDYATALREWRPLAERGNRGAQNNLGVMYSKGQGVLKDYKEAVKWYTKAANQGHANAQFALGWMYDEGHGVLKDYKEAVKWYTKAANQGNAGAQYNLGHMYKKGLGVLKDYKEAAKWFRKAARQGDTDSQYNLGVLNLDGKLGNTNKLIKAYMWFNIASMNDSVISSKKRDEVDKKLTFSQILRANRRASEWFKKHKN